MLVDGAKYGDVEIPIFCYEPKLGQPVGACRMCLVEIEGIPKLQTACSTPIRDGMVVHTQTQRVHEAQRAVVEFLLDQPPARLPGLRQGRRVPAAGRHLRLGPRDVALHRAQAPLQEAARALAADRDRPRALHPLLPLRALLAGGLRGLPAGPASSAAPRPTSAPSTATRTSRPFSGNIIELCPVGALTSRAYRFRARPWDIEGAGTVCAGCPAQCNVELTVRDERVLRVLSARPRRGRRRLAVRQGPLQLPGRALRRADRHADGARGRRADARDLGQGDRRRGVGALKKAGNRAAALAGGHDDQRGGVPAAAAAARRPRLQPPERDAGDRAAARRAARAGRPEAAGLGARPRVRAHRAAGRLRPDRRGAGLGPAHPQGRAPPRHQGRRRVRAPDRARPDRDRRRCASRPAAARASWSRSTPR